MIQKKRDAQLIDLDAIEDEDLLSTKICKLPVKIEGTWLEDCVAQLYNELKAKGIQILPQCYLADEWLTPEFSTSIGIPFYLAHPALIRLEKKIMMEAEGSTRFKCMQLLRHEAGHALCTAYKLNKRKKWQQIFGSSDKKFDYISKYRPYSKNFVRHLDGFYAQYHPEEDFVETFAVWLTPGMDWKAKYKGWKALEKLNYVDRLIKEINTQTPKCVNNEKLWRKSTLRYTLKSYYRRRRDQLAEEIPDFHDGFLRKYVTLSLDADGSYVALSSIIRKNRMAVVNSVAAFSGQQKYIVNEIIKKIQKRAQELKIQTSVDELSVVMNLSAYITTMIMNYVYTGQYRGDIKRK